MTTPQLPSLAGLAYPVPRVPQWSNTKTESQSGKETAVKWWSSPRYEWTLSWNVLRTTVGNPELQTLAGFFGSLAGGGSVFLYRDPDDNTVTGQAIATGDGSTKTFQLQRTFGNGLNVYTENVYAPNTSATKVAYVDGVATTATWNDFDSATPGTITFASAPANGKAITADFSFFFPCRFVDDTMTLNLFMSGLYEAQGVAFKSIK